MILENYKKQTIHQQIKIVIIFVALFTIFWFREKIVQIYPRAIKVRWKLYAWIGTYFQALSV